jgi:endoglucanase
VDPAITKAQRITIHTRTGPVKGVVGNVAPHLMRDSGDKERKAPKMEELFIDIGVGSRKAAEELVRVGDPITLNDEFELLRNDLAVARGFDNRIGTFAVAETLRLLRDAKNGLKAEISAVSNIMEEVGLFGARQIAYTLKPDAALVVDVTHATDYPTVNKAQHGEIRIGAGPALTHGGSSHPVVVARLEAIARDRGIAVQHEAVSATSGTDADAIFWTRGGIPCGVIGLPNRYMHSPVELVSLKDLEQIPDLMSAFALSLQPGEAFRVEI